MSIANEIRALRQALQEDTVTFGQRWHRSGRTIEDWEQDRRHPDAFTLAAIRTLAAATIPRRAGAPRRPRRGTASD